MSQRSSWRVEATGPGSGSPPPRSAHHGPGRPRRTDHRSDRTRRAFFRRGALLASAGVLGTAGCLAPERPDPGVEGIPGYARWLPSRGALGIGDAYYSFSHLDVDAVVAKRDRFEPSEYRSFVDGFDGEGALFPPVETVSGVTLAYASADGSTLLVAEGSFDAGVAARRIRAAGFERTTDHDGFALHEGADGTLGVGDGVLAGSISPWDRHGDLARRVLDAGRGTARRLVDDEDGRELVATLGDGLNALGLVTPGNLEDGYGPEWLAVAGRSVGLDDRAATVEVVLVYDDPVGVDLASVEATAVEPDNALRGTREVSASASGRVATVAGRTDPERLRFDGLTVRVE